MSYPQSRIRILNGAQKVRWAEKLLATLLQGFVGSDMTVLVRTTLGCITLPLDVDRRASTNLLSPSNRGTLGWANFARALGVTPTHSVLSCLWPSLAPLDVKVVLVHGTSGVDLLDGQSNRNPDECIESKSLKELTHAPTKPTMKSEVIALLRRNWNSRGGPRLRG